jgi:hypothetical protein
MNDKAPGLEKDNWDRQLEEGLPDCRLQSTARRRTQVLHANMWMEKVFCANCGCDGGLVTAGWAEHVFYLCDPCAGVRFVGAIEIPEEAVRGMPALPAA